MIRIVIHVLPARAVLAPMVSVTDRHLQWYSRGRSEAAAFRQRANRIDEAREQFALTREFPDRTTEERLAA